MRPRTSTRSWRRDNYELDASIGLHYTDLSSSLKAKVEASGGTLTEDISNSASVAAPLPVIGLRGIWDLSHNFWLDATAQFFALSIDEYDGNLQDYRVLVTWQPKTWLGYRLLIAPQPRRSLTVAPLIADQRCYGRGSGEARRDSSGLG